MPMMNGPNRFQMAFICAERSSSFTSRMKLSLSFIMVMACPCNAATIE